MNKQEPSELNSRTLQDPSKMGFTEFEEASEPNNQSRKNVKRKQKRSKAKLSEMGVLVVDDDVEIRTLEDSGGKTLEISGIQDSAESETIEKKSRSKYVNKKRKMKK